MPSELQRGLAAPCPHPLPGPASLPVSTAVTRADFQQGRDGLPGAAAVSIEGPRSVGLWEAGQVSDRLEMRNDQLLL